MDKFYSIEEQEEIAGTLEPEHIVSWAKSQLKPHGEILEEIVKEDSYIIKYKPIDCDDFYRKKEDSNQDQIIEIYKRSAFNDDKKYSEFVLTEIQDILFMTNKGLYSSVCHNLEDKNFQKILSETLDVLKKTKDFSKEFNSLLKERIEEFKTKKPNKKQKETDQLDKLDKEDYITTNGVLFREFTSLLKIKYDFKDDDPPEWKEHIENQIEELHRIQSKIHKIIMELDGKKE